MRIRTHISLLLAVGIAGAFALAVGIGSSLWIVARRVEHAGEVATDLRRVEAFILCSHDLMRDFYPAVMQAEARAARPGLVERCREDLASLRMSNLLGEDPILERVTASFEKVARYAKPGAESPSSATPHYLGAAAEYGRDVGALMDLASSRAYGEQHALATFRTKSIWILGGLSLLYLAAVLSVYGWTVRRLVSPIERLTREVEAAASDPARLLEPGMGRQQ